MISAREALALPSAKMSDSDAEAVEKLLADVDAHVRAKMLRNGFYADKGIEIEPSRVNGEIVLEVERRLRLLGWKAQFQVAQMPNSLGMVVKRFQLELKPEDEAYRDEGANGVFARPVLSFSDVR